MIRYPGAEIQLNLSSGSGLPWLLLDNDHHWAFPLWPNGLMYHPSFLPQVSLLILLLTSDSWIWMPGELEKLMEEPEKLCLLSCISCNELLTLYFLNKTNLSIDDWVMYDKQIKLNQDEVEHEGGQEPLRCIGIIYSFIHFSNSVNIWGQIMLWASLVAQW